MRCKKKIFNSRGFSLIELIIVLSVLLIISLIAVPKYITVQEKARVDADLSTIGNIVKAAELYVSKNNISSSSIVYVSDLISAGLLENDIKWQSSSITPVTQFTVEIDGSVSY